MSILTTLTRMWLTRSCKPFEFLNEYDEVLQYQDCEQLGLYIHIPFCRSLCNFCPYCKTIFIQEQADRYVDALLKEIHLVGKTFTHKKRVTSLYFGGGSPALLSYRLKEILDAVQTYFIISDGIGIELHPEDVKKSRLQEIKDAGITKISIGIQSFQAKFQSILGRSKVSIHALKKALSAVSFETVSIDLIFALPDQTYEDLRQDVDLAFANGANHVAIYPFIDFTFTTTKITALSKQEKKQLLDQISAYLDSKGMIRTSIWTFSNAKNANYSSMTRDNFLGFGCSATTLLKDQFKINTFSVDAYCQRIEEGKLPTSLTLRFTKRQRMLYYLFWTAYSTEIHEKDFEEFFNVPLNVMYGKELKLAEYMGFIKKQDDVYRLSGKGAFYFHYYEHFYTLAYIDKMWGIMREEAFPSKIQL